MDELLYNVTSMLSISNVNKSDETMYTCSSENGVRNIINVMSTAASQLTVQGMDILSHCIFINCFVYT